MRCKVCDSLTAPYSSLPTNGLDEPFLDDDLRKQLPVLQLSRCNACGCIWADDARQDENMLLDAYARAPLSYFGEPVSDRRFASFYRSLERILLGHTNERSIVDVGCGDGAFLAALSSQWTKRGIEPSQHGVKIAKTRSLSVECAAFADGNLTDYPAVVSALDVIEHLVDPHRFVARLAYHAKPDTLLLIVTGDTDSWPARTAGSYWSYLRWAGHISIFSRIGLERLLRQYGFEIIRWQRCDHPAGAGALAWWRVFLFEPARRILGRNPSWYPFWRDHQAVIARFANREARNQQP